MVLFGHEILGVFFPKHLDFMVLFGYEILDVFFLLNIWILKTFFNNIDFITKNQNKMKKQTNPYAFFRTKMIFFVVKKTLLIPSNRCHCFCFPTPECCGVYLPWYISQSTLNQR